MGVTLTSTFLLGDLQYDVHTFQTWIWVQKHEFPQKWHPTWLYCTLIKIVKMEVTLTSFFYTLVTSIMIYIFFQPGFEFSTL